MGLEERGQCKRKKEQRIVRNQFADTLFYRKKLTSVQAAQSSDVEDENHLNSRSN